MFDKLEDLLIRYEEVMGELQVLQMIRSVSAS